LLEGTKRCDYAHPRSFKPAPGRFLGQHARSLCGLVLLLPSTKERGRDVHVCREADVVPVRLSAVELDEAAAAHATDLAAMAFADPSPAPLLCNDRWHLAIA